MITFDPFLHIDDLAIRWQTIGVTLALLAAFALAALLAPQVSAQRPLLRGRSPDLGPRFPEAPAIDATGAATSQPPAPSPRLPALGDLVLILGGIVPGAVIGGRLVHAFAFWDAYAAAPLTILDPSVGTLSLTGAVLGGALTGAYVARLIGAPVRRWADTAAVPMLLAIGLGKLAQLLGGSGQGLPFDGPWALAFGGPGPWISANPDIPSHPSQVYEGLWVLVGIPIVALWSAGRRVPASLTDGKLFVGALTWFLLGRVFVGFTWRDDPLLGPLNAEQLVALAALVAIGLSVALWLPRYRGRVHTRAEERAP